MLEIQAAAASTGAGFNGDYTFNLTPIPNRRHSYLIYLDLSPTRIITGETLTPPEPGCPVKTEGKHVPLERFDEELHGVPGSSKSTAVARLSDVRSLTLAANIRQSAIRHREDRTWTGVVVPRRGGNQDSYFNICFYLQVEDMGLGYTLDAIDGALTFRFGNTPHRQIQMGLDLVLYGQLDFYRIG